jgi:LmbE family N-acetylglucosaminyl deacetylase
MQKNKIRIFLVVIALFLLPLFCFCFAEGLQVMPEFTKDDRVLILTPHPDDETIGTVGVIQKVLKAGAKIRVVFYTNGDNNELAFIVYEKRLTFRKREFLHMGEVRRREAMAAMTFLGLRHHEIIFLGYPDFGTMEILTKYWGEVKPFKTLFTRVNEVSYPGTLSFHAPFVGESILKDIKTIILDFKPNKIFVSHPADTNRDHRSLYLFLRIALWDLQNQIKQPELFPYIIHVIGWPTPRGYKPDLEITPPKDLRGFLWHNVPLAEEEMKTKHDAIEFYKSQIKYSPSYLFTFARKNEIFSDLPVIKLKNQNAEEITWQSIRLSCDNDVRDQDSQKETNSPNPASAYALKGGNLLIKIPLRSNLYKNFGVYVYLLGYSKQTDFSQMPKLQLSINTFGLHIKDKKQPLFIKDIQLKHERNAIILKIPLSKVGNPDYILSCIRKHPGPLPLDETAWRVIEME